MKIEIMKEGSKNPEVVELKGLKGRDIKYLVGLLVKLQAADTGKETSDCTLKYMDELDKTAARISGMNVDALNDLDIEEKEKITGYIGKKTQDMLGFTMPSTK